MTRRFWNASGIDLTLNASGLSVNTQTLASVLAGGHRLRRRRRAARARGAGEHRFTLFTDRRSALAPADGLAVQVRMVVRPSVRGLADGRGDRPARRRDRPGHARRAPVRPEAPSLSGRGPRRHLSASPRPGPRRRCCRPRRRGGGDAVVAAAARRPAACAPSCAPATCSPASSMSRFDFIGKEPARTALTTAP